MALRIPKSIAVESRIEQGSTMDMTLSRNGILVKPQGELTLESLLADVTKENLHTETDFGKPEGNEVW